VAGYSQRGVGKTYISQLLERGLSANAALKWLQEMGAGYRRQEFLADWREAQGAQKARAIGKYVRKDRYPGSACIVETSVKLKERFQHRIVLQLIDITTGQRVEPGYMSFASNSIYTRGEIEAAALQKWNERAMEDPDKYKYLAVGAEYQYTFERGEEE